MKFDGQEREGMYIVVATITFYTIDIILAFTNDKTSSHFPPPPPPPPHTHTRSCGPDSQG